MFRVGQEISGKMTGYSQITVGLFLTGLSESQNSPWSTVDIHSLDDDSGRSRENTEKNGTERKGHLGS
jgi:hypothetical protein